MGSSPSPAHQKCWAHTKQRTSGQTVDPLHNTADSMVEMVHVAKASGNDGQDFRLPARVHCFGNPHGDFKWHTYHMSCHVILSLFKLSAYSISCWSYLIISCSEVLCVSASNLWPAMRPHTSSHAIENDQSLSSGTVQSQFRTSNCAPYRRHWKRLRHSSQLKQKTWLRGWHYSFSVSLFFCAGDFAPFSASNSLTVYQHMTHHDTYC